MDIASTERDQTLAADKPPPDRRVETNNTDLRKHRPTRLSSAHAWLLIGAVVLAVLLIFIAQNTQSIKISFAGASIHVALAVALLVAAVAGGLLVGAIGGARIGQLRRVIRRSRQ
jgi:uncharacterized integral membrane protein